MRAVVQRAESGSVTVNGDVVAAIGKGYVVFLGIEQSDTEAEAAYLARKIADLRIFEDDAGKMNLAIGEVSGEVLAVSQFTLCADVRRGRRPSFTEAARPEHAQPLYVRFCDLLREEGIRVATGIFQAHMAVSIVNDGPVTLWLDTESSNGRVRTLGQRGVTWATLAV